MAMKIEELAERSQAMLLEWQLLREELKNYANEHPAEADKADPAYRRKANNFPSDLTPARVARVSNKLMYP